MPTFSQRVGETPIKNLLQLKSMDDDLRNGLWNCLTVIVLPRGTSKERITKNFFRQLWAQHFKQPLDSMPGSLREMTQELRTDYFSCEWYEVYNLIEFAARVSEPHTGTLLRNSCNRVLEMELSAYRFVGEELTPITSEAELEAVRNALEISDEFKPVKLHFKSAVALFSDRKNPDYRNSIKESISAVEAICKLITGNEKGTLADALKRLESAGVPLHSALRQSFDKLYGYVNDAQGIRHALLDESTLDFDDAKFMLVSCSAFVNYLTAKATNVGVISSGRADLP